MSGFIPTMTIDHKTAATDGDAQGNGFRSPLSKFIELACSTARTAAESNLQKLPISQPNGEE
jgi:hypothetical protein